MDVEQLDRTVCSMYQAGLAPSTQRAYGTGKKRYLNFCERLGAPSLPVTETRLCQFVAFLKLEGLRHQTVKSYLSAVRHMQISQGLDDPRISGMPRLELVIRGMKRMQAGLPSKPRLPITPAILRRIRAEWEHSKEWDHIMLWAMMCLCFFGFLRAGEAVAPEANFDPSQHLTYSDIAVDDIANPTLLQVNIKQSKTDPFRVGVKIWMGRTGGDLCPVAAVLAYMALRGPGEGPLFRFQDGSPLTRQKLVTKLREVLQKVGIDCSKYSGHSFRIGAATTAAEKGIQDSLIKTMGRWESVAYQLYVRTPQAQLLSVSQALASQTVITN